MASADLDTRKIVAFILTFYSANAARDTTQLIQKYLNEQCTGDYNTRWKKLLTDAS